MTTPLPLKDLPREEQVKIFEAFLDDRLDSILNVHNRAEIVKVNRDNHRLHAYSYYRIRPRRVSVDAELLDRLKEPAALLVGCNHTSNAVHVGLFANGVMELAASAEELP